MKAEELIKGMTSERIKEIQKQTAYPKSVSVKLALLQVWNECQQHANQEKEQFARQEVEKALEELEQWCSTPAEHGNSISLFDKIKELKNRQAPSKTT